MVERKTYVKPQVISVDLVPDEAILAYCKTSIAEGPDDAACGVKATCQVPGS